MSAKRASKRSRRLAVQWQECAWLAQVQVRPPDLAPPECYFIGLLGLGVALTAQMPPIILTPKTTPEYEIKHA